MHTVQGPIVIAAASEFPLDVRYNLSGSVQHMRCAKLGRDRGRDRVHFGQGCGLRRLRRRLRGRLRSRRLE